MESMLLMPPKSVRGMTELDRNKFNKSIKVPKLELGNSNTSSIVPYIKKYFLKMENLKPIQNGNNTSDNSKTALLNPLLIKNWVDIEPTSRENLVALGVNEKHFKIEELILTYDNWRPDEIFKSVLPLDKEGISSFSKIGHIVHVNLKDHLLPYKTLIGQVLLDKVKACRTVVNKIESIDTTFRFFKMEILCGEDNMQCQVKENHCRFEFDFSTVYWNPRLCTEHERISNMLKEGDILYDVFAGVGPFAIPCAKKKVVVLANDLNPNSYKWLNQNAKLNKINEHYLKTFNKDGRDFIVNDLKNDLVKRLKDNSVDSSSRIHITMNLPALAVEFLDAFHGLFSTEDLFDIKALNPLVHVYCFAQNDFSKKIAQERMENHLGHPIDKNLCELFHVRNVSPKKDMWRVSFELTSDILFGKNSKKRKSTTEAITDTKKNCHGTKEKGSNSSEEEQSV
ncbi:tRNA (guanine(37)-N1)-methyltransferase [Chrysoperla carnea]|uniref:tRNA (guanine(37)-N1)-methyltransferase n=1 Tax=Chrysoperla carnea TaxID=189513 RepID=UPI001D08B897|nr:tRNA (guanine(37)-N1)-methyltransferase [Chrysoperla carnea]